MQPPSYTEAQDASHEQGLPTYEEANDLFQWTPTTPLLYEEVMAASPSNDQSIWDRRAVPETSAVYINKSIYDIHATQRMSNSQLADFDFVQDYATYCSAIIPNA
jgi:hypothetical protein